MKNLVKSENMMFVKNAQNNPVFWTVNTEKSMSDESEARRARQEAILKAEKERAKNRQITRV